MGATCSPSAAGAGTGRAALGAARHRTGVRGGLVGLLTSLPRVAAADPALGGALPVGGQGWWAAAVVLAVQALLVARLARSPSWLLLLVAGLPLPLAVAAPPAVITVSAVAVLAAVVLTVASGALRAPRTAPVLVATSLLVGGGQTFATATSSGAAALPVVASGAQLVSALGVGMAQALVVVGLPALIGSLVVARRDLEVSRGQEMAAVRGEHAALLAAAVSRERTEMSRELHDIAAHHLSGIALLAGVISRQVETEPAAARRSADLVREQSRAVLDDLRRLVGLLREDGPPVPAVETLGTVPALVDSRRAAGVDVRLYVRTTAGTTDSTGTTTLEDVLDVHARGWAGLSAGVGPLGSARRLPDGAGVPGQRRDARARSLVRRRDRRLPPRAVWLSSFATGPPPDPTRGREVASA